MTNCRRLVLVPFSELICEDAPLLSLGVWCSVLPRLAKVQMVSSPYSDRSEVIAAGRKVQIICDTILETLAQRLNELHEVEFDVRQWRILLSPWLMLFVSSSYDRYLRLKLALKDYPGFNCKILDESSCSPCDNTIQAAYALGTDHYNLQLMSRLLRNMGHNFPSVKLSKPDRQGQLKSSRLKQYFKVTLSRMISLVLSLGRPVLLLHSSYFQRKVEFRLARDSGFSIIPWLAQNFFISSSSVQLNLRSKLSNLHFGDDEFERCLTKLLPEEIPVSLLEDFHSYDAAAQIVYPNNITKVFTADSWYFDEVFKHLCVRVLKNEGKLIGIQHGGNYGSLELMLGEDHEIKITDKYYTWGWMRGQEAKDVFPMPASKLMSDYRESRRSVFNRDILWVTTSMPRYLTIYPFNPEDFVEYMSWQNRFLNSLDDEILSRIRHRPHFEDNGWNLKKNIQKNYLNLEIEDWKRSFKKSLLGCRLYVCDHLSTTFLEALSVNKPTILFWDNDINQIRDSSIYDYEELSRVGVLIHSPEKAALQISNIAHDIEVWWNESERQRVVKNFCNKFARNSSSAFKEWLYELKRIQNNNQL
jgi:putative transferase (TIGR04331 family)